MIGTLVTSRVGGHIGENDVNLSLPDEIPQPLKGIFLQKISLDQFDAVNRLHCRQIDSDNETSRLLWADNVGRDLTPSARGTPQIHNHLSWLQDLVFLIYLRQFERGS